MGMEHVQKSPSTGRPATKGLKEMLQEDDGEAAVSRVVGAGTRWCLADLAVREPSVKSPHSDLVLILFSERGFLILCSLRPSPRRHAQS